MLLSGATTRCSLILFTKASQKNPISKRATTAAAATAAALLLSAAAAIGDETLSNVPQTLSSECVLEQQQDCKKRVRIQRPKSRKAETCTSKCVGTCIQGGSGSGSPGEGPLNIRR